MMSDSALAAVTMSSTETVDAAHRPVASYRTNLVTVLVSLWFTLGLFLDAWAHSNVPELETFFTPWHAVFYTGFVATAAWISWTARHALRLGRRGIPIGYTAAVVALAGFALAAVADLTWHTVFGIEQTINILFSPSHIGLAAAMFVIVTTPARAAWADPDLSTVPGLRRLLPAVVSTSLAAALVLLFLSYADALSWDSARVVVGMSSLNESFTIELVSAMAVTNLVLLLPLLVVARRWVLPFGTATILYAAMGALSGAISGFGNGAILAALLVAGMCVDVLARLLRPAPDRLLQFRLFAALTPLLTWTVYVATAYVTTPPLHMPPELGGGPVQPVIELYTGAPIVQALIGLLVGVLLNPARASPADV